MEFQGEEKIEILGEEKMNSFDMGEEKVEEVSTTNAHAHFAGRVPAGFDLPVCVSKNGVNHVSYTLGVFVLQIHRMYLY